MDGVENAPRPVALRMVGRSSAGSALIGFGEAIICVELTVFK
jgi:hypothetical protein